MSPQAATSDSKSRRIQKPEQNGEVRLSFSLAELPTSQHRAGLAGLVLMVRWMEKAPGKREGMCRVDELTEGGASFTFNKAGLAELFDQVYGASQEEIDAPSVRKDKKKQEVAPLRVEERKRVDEKTGKEKTSKVYVYPAVVPRGAFLPGLDPAGNGETGPWIKLWRDMVWSILRGVPATREPFEARAEMRAAGDAEELWAELCKKGDPTVELPSTYFLGAQAVTADNVRFQDRLRWQFLLHFWPFAAQLYVPVTVDPQKGQREFVGFAIAVPDIGRLETFCDELPELLKARACEMSGYRPRGCLVDVPAESALDLGRRISDRLRQLEGDKDTSDLVLGFDVFHMKKEGNNIRMLSKARIEPDAQTVDKYKQIHEAYWSPSFRKRRLLNLLGKNKWWHGFDELMQTLPYKQHTIGSEYFRHDCKHAFRNEDEPMNTGSTTEEPRPLEQIVYGLVGSYLGKKVRSKSGLDWETAKGSPEQAKRYNEAKEKLAKDAFLAIRSRSGADFVDYFASTLCSVPQYIKPQEMVELSRALRTQSADIRVMTLLALSAWG